MAVFPLADGVEQTSVTPDSKLGDRGVENVLLKLRVVGNVDLSDPGAGNVTQAIVQIEIVIPRRNVDVFYVV